MSRLDASASLKRQIRMQFQDQCAACACEHKLCADVAHLYEDATKQPPKAETLIILCSNCNQSEDRSKNRNMPPLSERFDAEEIANLGRRRYREGRYSNSYASHRFAAYLFEKQGSYSKSVEYLAEAMSAVRPIRRGNLLAATFKEVDRICQTYRVGKIQRWLCLDRFSLVLYDYCRWKESWEVHRASQQICADVVEDQRYPEQLKLDRTNSFRREVLIKTFTDSISQALKCKILDELFEMTCEFKQQKEFDSFASNLDVAARINLSVFGDREKAHEYSEMVINDEEKITHKWILQEQYWREADYYLVKRDRKRMKSSVFAALSIFNKYPTVLQPRLERKGPVVLDPIADLGRYRIPPEELREHSVAPSGDPPKIKHLELNSRTLIRIVKSIKR